MSHLEFQFYGLILITTVPGTMEWAVNVEGKLAQWPETTFELMPETRQPTNRPTQPEFSLSAVDKNGNQKGFGIFPLFSKHSIFLKLCLLYLISKQSSDLMLRF